MSEIVKTKSFKIQMTIKNKFDLLDIVEDLFGNEYYISEIRISIDGNIIYEIIDEKLGGKLVKQNEITKSKLKTLKNKICI